MRELTNKELVDELYMVERYLADKDEHPFRGLMQAVIERLAAMPDVGEQEPIAHMFPDDIERFSLEETSATAYSVEMMSPGRGKTVPLYTQPQQPAPEGGPTEHQVYQWFQEATIKHHIQEDGSHISARANYVAQQSWNAARSELGKETIKRYCLDFCRFLSKRGVLCAMFGAEKLVSDWWQQSARRGGE